MRSSTLSALLSVVAFLVFGSVIQAQYVQTKRPAEDPANIVNNAVRGYIEALPSDYNDPANATTKYPLLLFFQGLSEAGTGSSSDLDKLLSWDRQRPTKMIEEGTFPASVTTLSGQTFKFIVISPQFTFTALQYPTPQEIDQLITYMINRYRVDPTRVYLTGLSTGAGSIYYYAGSNPSYANRLAAIVPFSGTYGTDNPSDTTATPVRARMRVIAESNLPVWAFHRANDPSVPTSITQNHVNFINEATPAQAARLTLLTANGQHDSWQEAYNCPAGPNCYTENGENMYQWMLRFTRAAVTSPLPVKLKNLQANKSTNKVVVSWETESEQDNKHFTLERSSNGAQYQKIATIPAANRGQQYSYSDLQPNSGINYYRLSQTDLNGRTTYFQVLVVRDNGRGQKMSVAPNPVKDFLNLQIEAPATGIMRAAIYSATGVLVRDWKINKLQETFNESVPVSTLPAGNYLLKVEGKDFKESVRFVK